MDWLFFALAASAIVAAGAGLAVCGETVAARTGLGAVWFGAIALALVTSLPELVVDVSAVRRGAAALAVGDLLGSSMANMAILGAVAVAFPARRILQRAALEHVLTASLAIGLTALMLTGATGAARWSVGRVGAVPLLIATVYVGATYLIRERQVGASVQEGPELARALSLRMAMVGFAALATVVFVAGPVLARSADRLAEQTGLGETFFGAFALALVTSLPELSVSLAAVRIGAFNLAIANLLGSNAINMALLLPLDLAYGAGQCSCYCRP